jgi:hypothetical protein
MKLFFLLTCQIREKEREIIKSVHKPCPWNSKQYIHTCTAGLRSLTLAFGYSGGGFQDGIHHVEIILQPDLFYFLENMNLGFDHSPIFRKGITK